MVSAVNEPSSNSLPFRLSVLDQSPIPEGATGAQALHNSIDLARLADSLGYHRYWVAEHHGTPGLACAAPEVLIPAIACATSKIRVGSGGVMLPHYSPLKVAEVFTMLAGLFPGRIDLGWGGRPGRIQPPRWHCSATAAGRCGTSSAITSPSCSPTSTVRSRPITPLPASPARCRENRSVRNPGCSGPPSRVATGRPSWGCRTRSPTSSTRRAARSSAPVRDTFEPSATLDRPRTAVALWTVCADSDEEAQRLTSSFLMMMTLMHRGQLIPVPPPEKAIAFLETERAGGGRGLTLTQSRRVIAGTPQTVRAEVERVAAEYGAEEVFLVNILHDQAARRRSYELVAEAFGLSIPITSNTNAAIGGGVIAAERSS